MGSLRFSAAPDFCEPKKYNFGGNFDPYMVDWVGCNLWVLHPGVSSVIGRKKLHKKSSKINDFRIPFQSIASLSRRNANSSDRSNNTMVHGLEEKCGSLTPMELVEGCESNKDCNVASADGSLSLKNPVPSLMEINSRSDENNMGRKAERKIWNRVVAMNKAARIKDPKSTSTRKGVSLKYIRNYGESSLSLESSVEQCNSILKLLEKSNDKKAVEFFEWMKSHGKLKENPSAYRLALRALARKEDWNKAQILLQEMPSESGCELTSQVFNVLIFICAKRGLAEWGAKWFHRMLESQVQPDVATIGMLMGLYQKGSNLQQAEFTFECMRRFKLQCITGYSAMITIYTRLGLYGKSEEIISLMEEDGVPPDLENWLVCLNAYSQQGKLEEAELVLKSMLASGFSPNIVAYNTLITGYGKISNMGAAHHLFQSLRNIGLEPDETTYRTMVEGFGRADNYAEAVRYYEELKSSGFLPSSSNFYTIINLQARHGDKEGSVQTLKEMRSMGCQYSSILSSLLHAYEKVGRIEEVPLILKASFHDFILADPTSCSILVMAYVQNSLLDEALQVLQDKRWKDSEFEDNLYHLLICSCKEAGHYENAIKIYNQMPKSKKNPNFHITCSMIDIYGVMGKFTDAESLYLTLKASEGTFDMVAYSIVLRMYIKAGSLKDACVVLDLIEKRKDIVPDTFLFRDMLRTYQQCGMLEKLASVYYQILKSGVTWDEAMYNCVINCCGHALPVDELSRLFDEMIQRGYAANTITFNVMLDVYGKARFLKKARKVFWMARKQGLADVISYNTVIAAYGRSKNFKNMRSVVQRMQHEGFPVSLEAYNCMLDAYGKEDLVEEFNDVLQKMKQASCGSDHYTYNIMINIYGKKGWIEEVAHVLAELKDHGLEPDLYSYNTLIKAYGISGMVEEAVNVVQEMRAKGIKPDRITYSNLIVALQRNENFLEAVKWSLWMKQMELSSQSHIS